MKKGFTLLELLMVVSLLGLILVAVTQLLGASFSGASKASALQLVKENGQFALSTIERTLRNANRVTSCGGSLGFIVSEAGAEVTYTFDVDSDRLQKSVGGATSFLTDEDLEVTNFSCVLLAGSPGTPAVYDISLTLQKPGITSPEIISATTFETTVSLRTY